MAGGRRVRYKLEDPFLAMWYACVRPHLSGLTLGAASGLRHAREAWTHHVAAIWESICRRQWQRLGFQGLEWEPAGRYWAGSGSSGSEWDVVAVSADRRHVFLGDCKWLPSATSAKLREVIQTISKRPIPPLAGEPVVHLGIFLPDGQGLSREVEGVAALDAKMIIKCGGC